MDLDTLRFLTSPEGEEAIRLVSRLSDDPLRAAEILRKRLPKGLAAAVLLQAKLRERALRKFSNPSGMLFTGRALQQASKSAVAAYHADILAPYGPVADLCCGLGGDTLAFAGRNPVEASDADPLMVALARWNCNVKGAGKGVRFSVGRAEDYRGGAGAIFIDPDRRPGGRRVRSITRSEPSWSRIQSLFAVTPRVLLKAAPAQPMEEIREQAFCAEYIAEGSECRECLLRFGELIPRGVSVQVTVLPGRKTFPGIKTSAGSKTSPGRRTLVGKGIPPPPVAPPGRYIVDPIAAVARAHLIGELAREIGGWPIAEGIAYLSTDTPRESPFCGYYEVLEVMPFNIKKVVQALRSLKAGDVVVKKRGFPLPADAVLQELQRRGFRDKKSARHQKGHGVVLILTRAAKGHTAILALPSHTGRRSADR
jgi:predicted RNA methylase